MKAPRSRPALSSLPRGLPWLAATAAALLAAGGAVHLSASRSVKAGPPQAQKIKIPAGTPVEIELKTSLSPQIGNLDDLTELWKALSQVKHPNDPVEVESEMKALLSPRLFELWKELWKAPIIQPGVPVEFVVSQSVQVEGRTIIPRGAVVRARVEDFKTLGMHGPKGTLAVKLDGTSAADGTPVPLRFPRSVPPVGPLKGEALPSKIFWVATLPARAALSPLTQALIMEFRSGWATLFSAGERFEVFVLADTEIEARGNADANPPPAEPGPQPETDPARRFLVLAETDYENLKEINAAAAKGYRVLFVSRPYLIVMEKVASPQERYRYATFSIEFNPIRGDTNAGLNTLNAVAALGYRATPSLFEKPAHPKTYFYLDENIHIIPEGCAHWEIHIWECPGEPPAELARKSRGKKTQSTLAALPKGLASRAKKIHEMAAQGYRLHTKYSMEKVSSSQRYSYRLVQPKNFAEMEAVFNAGGAEGFRVLPRVLDGKDIFLEKEEGAPTGYAYRFLKLDKSQWNEAEMAEAVRQGYRPVTIIIKDFWSIKEFLLLEKVIPAP